MRWAGVSGPARAVVVVLFFSPAVDSFRPIFINAPIAIASCFFSFFFVRVCAFPIGNPKWKIQKQQILLFFRFGGLLDSRSGRLTRKRGDAVENEKERRWEGKSKYLRPKKKEKFGCNPLRVRRCSGASRCRHFVCWLLFFSSFFSLFFFARQIWPSIFYGFIARHQKQQGPRPIKRATQKTDKKNAFSFWNGRTESKCDQKVTVFFQGEGAKIKDQPMSRVDWSKAQIRTSGMSGLKKGKKNRMY